MKGRLVFILFVCATMSGFFLTTTTAQTTQVRSGHLQPDTRVQADIPGMVAEVVAQALAAEGYEVYRDGTSVMIATHLGELGMKLPATREAMGRGEITFSIDGIEVMRGDDVEVLEGLGEGIQLFECINAALGIYDLQNEVCFLGQADIDNFLCFVRSSFDLVLNILQCVGPPG